MLICFVDFEASHNKGLYVRISVISATFFNYVSPCTPAPSSASGLYAITYDGVKEPLSVSGLYAITYDVVNEP